MLCDECRGEVEVSVEALRDAQFASNDDECDRCGKEI